MYIHSEPNPHGGESSSPEALSDLLRVHEIRKVIRGLDLPEKDEILDALGGLILPEHGLMLPDFIVSEGDKPLLAAPFGVSREIPLRLESSYTDGRWCRELVGGAQYREHVRGEYESASFEGDALRIDGFDMELYLYSSALPHLRIRVDQDTQVRQPVATGAI